MAANWFRNEAWNPAIAAAFDVRLRRARDKSQYLAIQAYCLRIAHPTVALELTDRCFEITQSLAHSMDATRAYEVRAVAHLALGNIEAAFANFDIVLERERQNSHFRTNVCFDYPYLIALLGVTARFDQALAIMNNVDSGLSFPATDFKQNAARAIIFSSKNLHADAKSHACAALTAAARTHSGLRYHADIGLVRDADAEMMKALQRIAASE